MEFPVDFFEDEVREGFYVSGIMKRAWAAQMEVLQYIADICDKNKIRWFADGGTLLGAVRHKGYIPWDDDMDICMFRDDYERFLKIVQRDLPDSYVLRTVYSEPAFYELFSRLVYTGESSIRGKEKKWLQEFPFPAGVDIFPLDYISKNVEKEDARYQIFKALSSALYADEQGMDVDYEKLVHEVELLKRTKIDRKLPQRQQLYICMDQVLNLFPASDAEYVTHGIYYVHDRTYKMSKSVFKSIVKLPFEHGEINAPIDYDAFLTREYGDYRKIVKTGGAHGYPFFKKHEETIYEKYGKYPVRYEFDQSDLECSDREHGKTLIAKIDSFTAIARKVLEVLLSKLSTNAFQGLDKVLESCQTAAINTGEMIERRCGLNTKTVGCLEAYCELIFQVYEKIVSSHYDEIKPILDSMHACIDDFITWAREEVCACKEIVFLVYKPKYWAMYSNEWKKAMDAGHKVTVISAPYYELDAYGRMGELHCDTEGYPEDVQTVSFEEYDFLNNHPDIIYIQNPYDEYNRVVTVASFFYAKNLRKYTEKLVYIPFFTMDEIDTDKARQTMDYFCRVPGVVCSDLVLVQSENMRQAYISYLTELSGEEYRPIWEDKIQVRQ